MRRRIPQSTAIKIVLIFKILMAKFLQICEKFFVHTHALYVYFIIVKKKLYKENETIKIKRRWNGMDEVKIYLIIKNVN